MKSKETWWLNAQKYKRMFWTEFFFLHHGVSIDIMKVCNENFNFFQCEFTGQFLFQILKTEPSIWLSILFKFRAHGSIPSTIQPHTWYSTTMYLVLSTYSGLSNKRAARFILFWKFSAKFKFWNHLFIDFLTPIEPNLNGICFFQYFFTVFVLKYDLCPSYTTLKFQNSQIWPNFPTCTFYSILYVF